MTTDREIDGLRTKLREAKRAQDDEFGRRRRAEKERDELAGHLGNVGNVLIEFGFDIDKERAWAFIRRRLTDHAKCRDQAQEVSNLKARIRGLHAAANRRTP